MQAIRATHCMTWNEVGWLAAGFEWLRVAEWWRIVLYGLNTDDGWGEDETGCNWMVVGGFRIIENIIQNECQGKSKAHFLLFILFHYSFALSILFSIYIWDILFVKIFYFRKCDKSSKIEFSVNCIYWEHDGMAWWQYELRNISRII